MIQGWLTQVYERRGPRGLIATGHAWCAVITILALELVMLAAGEYVRASFSEMLPYYLASALALAVLQPVLAFPVMRDVYGVLRRWPGEPHTQELAQRVWRAVVKLPRAYVIRLGLIAYGGVLLTVPVWLADMNQPGWIFLPTAVVWALLIPGFGLFAMLGLELVFRPMLRDVADHLPQDFEPALRRLPLRTKSLIPIPGGIVLAVMLSGAFADSTTDYGHRVLVALGLSVASAAIVAVLLLLSVHAVLDPVDELTAATQRVQGGDLTTPVPVLSDDELGALAVSFNEMLSGLQERDALREHNSALLADVQASRARIVATADEERRRMERDIHDGAQQRIVVLSLKLGLLASHLQGNASASALVDELRADAGLALDELRDLAHGIYPPLLESDGLAGALEDIGDRSAHAVTVTCDHVERYRPEVEAAVYFCCLEALQNCAKHAGAGARTRVDVRCHDHTLCFDVTDDGPGFDVGSANGSHGLQNMRDRIGALGGELRIHSKPGGGTRVEGSVPV